MKQQILKEHNPIIIFLINCPCHASVVVYCLVLLELTSLLQGWFSALNILSAFWLLSDTISTGHIPQHSTWHPANKATVAYKFCGSAQSQGFSFHTLLAHTAVIWVLLQCDITLPPSQMSLSRRTSFETSLNSQSPPCARSFLPPCSVFYENRIS